MRLLDTTLLATGLLLLNPVSSSSDAEIDKLLKANLARAFIVQNPCTASFITADWIITAAHCTINKFNFKENENGDLYVSRDQLDRWQVFTFGGADLDEKDLWTTPILISPKGSSAQPLKWRQIEEIIQHGNFESEAYSWMGSDLTLMRLKSGKGLVTPQGVFAPVCLAASSFEDMDSEHLYTAGFGRRFVPHCLTDLNSPEAFETCGRPVPCSQDHRTTKCGLDFLYKGTQHHECLKVDTPSANDPECINLRKAVPSLETSNKTIHIFNSLSTFLTTCYPKRSPANGKGWCTTRTPGVHKNVEPSFHSGWGFCSDHPSQKMCNKEIDAGFTNTTAMPVSFMEKTFCVDKLEVNLKVEQPDTTRDEFEDMQEKFNIICTGRNHTRRLEDDLFYDRNQSYRKIQNPSEDMIKKTKRPRYAIDGGPNCFGDSGGPLFRIITDADTKKPVPVLVGVFSFILWGTCQGHAEPAYFGRVSRLIEWLKLYVPMEKVCMYGKDGKRVSSDSFAANKPSSSSSRSSAFWSILMTSVANAPVDGAPENVEGKALNVLLDPLLLIIASLIRLMFTD